MSIAAVFGLGNPGREYVGTRHNAGYGVVEALAERWSPGPWRLQYDALVRDAGAGHPLLVKPITFMNRSGLAVETLCSVAGLSPNACLIVVDDVELTLGRLRLRAQGSAGTHNGLGSIVEHVGEVFPRLRLGIRGETPWDELADYVLSPFSEDEVEIVAEMTKRAVECVETLLVDGMAAAASRFNSPAA